MNIKRTMSLKLDGDFNCEIPLCIELLPREKRHAYEEQQHLYDLDDIDNELAVAYEQYKEDFNIHEKPVTAVERECMARELRRILENDPDCTVSQCRCDAVTRILKVRSNENDEPQTYIVTEVCPHCENEIEMVWNTKERGFQAHCPVCSCRLMLCDECLHSGEACDYNRDTDSCHMQSKEV